MRTNRFVKSIFNDLSDLHKGRLLAIAGSDNHIRLLGAHNGKIAHDLPCGPPQGREDASISCVAWGPHVTESKDTIESWLRPPDDGKSVGSAPGKAFPTISADLPRDLALLDVERSLPKLSVLPSTGDEYVAHFGCEKCWILTTF